MANKNEKLMEKVEKLTEKIGGEQNSLKRAIYSVVLESLLGKIQKEIDIRDIKEKYSQEREDRTEEAKNRIKSNTKRKMDLINQRDYYKNQARGLSDFDPDSPKFAFKDELKLMDGDVFKLIDDLRQEGNTELATKIEEAMIARDNHEQAKEELQDLKSEGIKINKQVSRQNAKSSVKETALVAAKKVNIFKRAFDSIKKGIKEYRETRKENKEFKKESKSIKVELQERQNEELENLNREYEQLMLELKEKRSEIQERYSRQKSSVKNRENFAHSLRNQEASERSNTIVQEFKNRQPEKVTESEISDGQEPGDD